MIRTTTRFAGFLAAAALVSATATEAHFLEVIPSSDVLPDGGPVTVDLVFSHPFDGGPVMELAKPVRVARLGPGGVRELTDALVAGVRDGKTVWSLDLSLDEPGASILFVEPQPYFEPAERTMIIHYTKVVVDAFASGEGWDVLAGSPVEIRPLTRPTGLWTGNLFTGVVLQDGAPVPFAEIEVEWLNDGTVEAPNDAFVTQVITADAAGTFSYAMPRAGWWGFAALIAGAETTAPDGTAASTELGALMWVKATDMPGR